MNTRRVMIADDVAAQPAAGATGSVRWTLTGSLASVGSGTVTYMVQILP